MGELIIEPEAYDLIPEHCRESVRQYMEWHVPVGRFLMAVFANDLMDALGRADHINEEALPNYGKFLYNHAPPASWGSPEKVKEWVAKGVLNREL